MALFEDTNPRELKELLRHIHSGEAALPDFQRDFVWEPNATQELIVSIANNYPAGSLLRIRNTQNLFAHREFQGAPPLDRRRATFLVLDGQQRLTSLYQAFYGVGDHRFFLNLRSLMEGKDFEEAIFTLRAATKHAKRIEKIDAQASALIAPLSVLKDGFGGYSQWEKKVIRHLRLNDPERVELEDRLTEVVERWIQKIDDYRFPVVTLSDETEADAVCTIFETLNRTGVKLSAFELLTARFWPMGVNLRQLWQEAQDAHSRIADFEVDPYYLLQIISLVARPTVSCKRSDVLKLESSEVEVHWVNAVTALDKTLQILKEDCGVVVPKWLPYATTLIPFAAILTKRPLPNGPKAAAMREKILRWYWCSIFGQAYESAPNSQAAKDVGEVVAWIDGGDAPEVVRMAKFDPRMLHDTTPRQRALYRGTMCLVVKGGSRDFHSNQPISGDLIVKNHIDDHHVFPDDYLKDPARNVPARKRDCILNRTLIDRTTNQKISNRSPSDYMQEIRKTVGDGVFRKLLSSHLIPHDPRGPIWRDDFDDYLLQREAALWDCIKEVTGITEASDLVEETEAA